MANEPWLYGPSFRVGPLTTNEKDRKAAEKRWREMQEDGTVYEPWLHGDGWRVGPATLTEKDRKAAEKRWQEMQPQKQGDAAPAQFMPPNFAGQSFYPPSNAMPLAAPQASVADPYGIVPDNVGVPTGGIHEATGATPQEVARVQHGQHGPTPGVPTGSTLLQDLYGIFADDPWRLLKGSGKQDRLPQKFPEYHEGSQLPDGPQRGPAMAGEGELVAPPVDPNAAMLEGVNEKLALINSIYPQRDMSETPEQARANAFAQRELDRTRLLANLAFASGVTAAGGGSWQQVAKGFTLAGGAYDRGFERYNAALQNAADQVSKARDVKYGDDVTRTDAALKLYMDERNRILDQAVEYNNKTRKEKIDFLQKSKPDEATVMTDPEAFSTWKRMYEYFLATGDLIPTDAVDVRGQ